MEHTTYQDWNVGWERQILEGDVGGLMGGLDKVHSRSNNRNGQMNRLHQWDGSSWHGVES